MRNCLFFLSIVLLTCNASAQSPDVDSVAVMVLDKMSAVIGDLGSCSFTLQTSQDMQDNSFFLPEEGLGPVKHFGEATVHMLGPDKMQVNSIGDRGHEGYWLNDSTLTYYSYKENNFARVTTPGNILDAIYTIHENYGIDFPAADFFNPYFTDDLLAESEKLYYLGTTQLKGMECFKIISANQERNVQLWIANDALMLPQKMVIVYLDQDDHPQYEATFVDWNLNPTLPESIFDFLPPPHASEIILLSQAEQNIN